MNVLQSHTLVSAVMSGWNKFDFVEVGWGFWGFAFGGFGFVAISELGFSRCFFKRGQFGTFHHWTLSYEEEWYFL